MVRPNLIIIIILVILVATVGILLTKNINLKPYAVKEYSAPQNSIAINPLQTTVNENEYFTVGVYFNTEELVYALSFDVLFDANSVKLVSAEEGNFFKKNNIRTYPIIKSDELGKIIFSNTILGSNEGVVGSDTLLKIKFQSLKKGVNKINLENLQIINSELQSITGISINGAKITIN